MFICFQYLVSVCINHKKPGFPGCFFYLPGKRGIYIHTRRHNFFFFFYHSVAFQSCSNSWTCTQTWHFRSSRGGKVKDRREHFTPGGCWTLQTCLNSPVMLFSTIRSFPTDIPTWLQGSSTVFLSFLFTSPPLMCLVSHFWHFCLFRSLELTCRASPGRKPSALALRSSCVSESAMAWLSVYCQCG